MSTTLPDDKDPPPRPMLAYLIGLGLGAVLLIFSYCFGIFALHATGTLPPPQFTNNSCADEKLYFLRNNSTDDADLLILGSSVAWRQFDGAAAADVSLRARNLAFCHYNLSETKAIADWILPRMLRARTVIIITSPLDYQGCAGRTDAPFNLDHANAYVFDHASPFLYYFRYFDPFALLENAARFTEDRTNPRQWNTLVMNEFGDAPMDPPGEGPSGYAEKVGMPPDAACLLALRSLASDIRESGRRLIVVDAPIAPTWKARYDPDGTALDLLNQRVDEALQGTGAEHWNGDAGFTPGPAGFFDAIHLRWPTAQAFARTLVQQVLLSDSAG
ncbi:MAG: hypothetical protein AB7V53_08700 [Dongiaceae bacterium]